MKNVKSFETFVSEIKESQEKVSSEHLEEGLLRKFLTGHETPADEQAAEAKFTKALEDAEVEVKKDPKKFAQGERWDVAKAFLIGKASENKFRGGLRIQPGGGEDKRLFIVYDAKATGLQQLAAASGARVDNPLGGR